MRQWEDLLVALEKEMGKPVIQQWLHPLKVLQFDAANLYLEAQNPLQLHWFKEQIQPKLKERFITPSGRPIRVHLSIVGEKKTEEKRAEAPLQQYDPFVGDNLEAQATFDTFIVEEENELAYKLLLELPYSAYNPIYLYGAAGAGKSHLLMAVAHRVQKKILYVRAETFCEHVVSAIRSGNMESFRRSYRALDALFIDDIHLLENKWATQEELFHTFNALHGQGKLLLFSGNDTPTKLSGIEERLISRFEWGIALKLEKLKESGLLKMLRMQAEHVDLALPEEVESFLLSSFHQNPARLQKALSALLLRCPGEKITRALAAEQLQDLLEEQTKGELTVEKILKTVASSYGIRAEDILGKSQNKECSLPRQVAMFLLREQLELPFQKIGKLFSRDHSTVMSSVKLIARKKQEPELASSLSEIQRFLL